MLNNEIHPNIIAETMATIQFPFQMQPNGKTSVLNMLIEIQCYHYFNIKEVLKNVNSSHRSLARCHFILQIIGCGLAR